MSFTINKTGLGYAPGFFLAEAECSRETRTIAQNHSQVVTAGNAKHVPMGAFWPANDSSTVKGIVYEDVDVTSGAMPGSVVTKGVVYLDRLPASPESGVQSALEALGFKFYATAPAATRPASFDKTELAEITVASTAGSGSGKTDVAISGYTPGAGERYAYKIAAAAPAAWLGMQIDSTWTVATFPLDELAATTGQYITVVSVDSTGAVVAAGSDDITAHA